MPRKKRLLVLLGAGSSVEQGFPSARELDAEVRQWAKEHVKRLGPDLIEALTPQTRANYFELLWNNRENYCAKLDPELRHLAESRTEPTYERVLGDLQLMMNAALGKPYGDPMLKWLTSAEIFRPLKIRPDSTDIDSHGSSKVFHAIQGQLHYLCARVAERIRGNSQLFGLELENGRGTAAFEPYRHLFDELSQEFSIGVYNLNYDSVALTALPSAFVGFDRKTGDFQPPNVLTRRPWDFLYHLHGSVHHRVRVGSREKEHDDFGLKIVWHEDLSQTGDGEDWEDMKDVRMAADGKRMLPASIVTGGLKLDQLQEEPFLTLYSALTRHAYEADAILVGGYGFADPHINSVINSMLRSTTCSGRRPPILVLTHNIDGPPTAKRHDVWATSLAHALRVATVTFRAPEFMHQKQWAELPEKLDHAGFERSLTLPVAIWNAGFLAADEHTVEIAKWLNGEVTALDRS